MGVVKIALSEKDKKWLEELRSGVNTAPLTDVFLQFVQTIPHKSAMTRGDLSKLKGFPIVEEVPFEISRLAKFTLAESMKTDLAVYTTYFPIDELRQFFKSKSQGLNLDRFHQRIEKIKETILQNEAEYASVTCDEKFRQEKQALLADFQQDVSFVMRHRQQIVDYMQVLVEIKTFKLTRLYVVDENIANPLETVYPLLTKMNRLYISSRKKYLEQTDKGYLTFLRTITDKQLIQHLEGIRTIGVFGGGRFTKFFTFDVDIHTLSKRDHNKPIIRNERNETDFSYHTVKAILKFLTVALKIPKEAIAVTRSGRKGYHIDVFAEEMIDIQIGKNIYLAVLLALGISANEVEFRPTEFQGVKLPFGYHRGTNYSCNLVDNTTLKPIENKKFLDIKPCSPITLFKKSEQCFNLIQITHAKYNVFSGGEKIRPNEALSHVLYTRLSQSHTKKRSSALDAINAIAASMRAVKQGMKTVDTKKVANTFLETSLQQKMNPSTAYAQVQEEASAHTQGSEDSLITLCENTLSTGVLLGVSSRHTTTIALIAYLYRYRNYDDARIVSTISSIFQKTLDEYPNRISSSYQFAVKEINRLLPYAKKFQIGTEIIHKDAVYGKVAIKYYKKEIELLSSLTEKEQTLAFALLSQSKIYAQSARHQFYTTYAQLAEYGFSGNRSRLLKVINKLTEANLISKQKQSKIRHSNIYTVKFEETQGAYTVLGLSEFLQLKHNPQNLVSVLADRIDMSHNISHLLRGLKENTPVINTAHGIAVTLQFAKIYTKEQKARVATTMVAQRIVQKTAVLPMKNTEYVAPSDILHYVTAKSFRKFYTGIYNALTALIEDYKESLFVEDTNLMFYLLKTQKALSAILQTYAKAIANAQHTAKEEPLLVKDIVRVETPHLPKIDENMLIYRIAKARAWTTNWECVRDWEQAQEEAETKARQLRVQVLWTAQIQEEEKDLSVLVTRIRSNIYVDDLVERNRKRIYQKVTGNHVQRREEQTPS